MKWSQLSRLIGQISEASDQLERAAKGDFGVKEKIDAAVQKKIGTIDGRLDKLTGGSLNAGKKLGRIVNAIDKLGESQAPGQASGQKKQNKV